METRPSWGAVTSIRSIHHCVVENQINYRASAIQERPLIMNDGQCDESTDFTTSTRVATETSPVEQTVHVQIIGETENSSNGSDDYVFSTQTLPFRFAENRCMNKR